MQYFRNKQNPLLKKAILAALISNLAAGNSFAQDTVPNTYVDLPVPQLTGWNDINVHTLDGVTGATPKSHVYPSEAAKNDPNVGSVAAVYWELDNGSGRSPGIQVVTDDFDVPTNNCIMSSGELENEDLGVVLPKTCSDPKYSSKRYFFELTSSDVPVDLVFDLGIKDIRYKGIKDPSTDGGAELAEFRANTDIGRIYRVIQKVINNTDERIASFTFEIGTGIGDGFQQLNYEEDGVSFELRTSVPRAFFEGQTGAPDIEVWDPMTFATFSPKMFNDGGKKGVFGFLDNEIAGFMPPQVPSAGVEKSSIIDSGTSIINGVIGSISANYFDVEKNYSSTTGESIDVPVPGNMILGYMLPDLLLPTVIGKYSVNELGGESDSIVAFWDGTDWRSGRAGLDGEADNTTEFPNATDDNYGIIPESQLISWAGELLGTGELGAEITRYDSFLSDDLSGLNTDIFIHINEKLFDENGALKLDSITLRVTANSVAEVIGDVPGTEEPAWMATPARSLASYLAGIVNNSAIAINDTGSTVGRYPETVRVLTNDQYKDGSGIVTAIDPSIVDSINIITGGDVTATANPNEFNTANGVITINDGSIVDRPEHSITYVANSADFTGADTFSYTVTVGAETSNAAIVKVSVFEEPIPDNPIANNDSATTFQDTAVIIDVLANDNLNSSVPVDITISIDSTPLYGTALVANDNSIVYTPSAGYIGIDRFSYNVTVDNKQSNSALITVRVDETNSTEQYMESSSSGHTSSLLLLGIAGLFLRRRKLNNKK